MRPSYDVIVIGAGAAGIMCAIEAGKRGRRVWLIDHSKKLQRKSEFLVVGAVTSQTFILALRTFCLRINIFVNQH